MPYAQMTFKANTVGVGFSEYLKDIAGTAVKSGKVAITNNTTDAIYVRVGSGTKPATPTSAYIPANDAWVQTYQIKAGITATFGEDSDGKGLVTGLQEEIAWVAGWCVAAGQIPVVGH